MLIKTKLAQLLLLLALLIGALSAVPTTTAKQAHVEANSTLAYSGPGITLMGDCSTESGSCT